MAHADKRCNRMASPIIRRGGQERESTATILDRVLHHSTTMNTRGESYRMKDRNKDDTLNYSQTRPLLS